jgi:hypothetical protein
MHALEEHDVDGIFLASGMEHHPEALRKLEKKAAIIGNDPQRLRLCENKERLFEVADSLGIKHPLTRRVQTVDEALDAAEELGYPAVLKPAFGGGGIGIKLASSPREVGRCFRRALLAGDGKSAYVQEYVHGTDASTSVLSNGEEARCLTVNEQIIGEKRLGVPRRFGYCGNVVPLNEPKLWGRLAEDSETICRELGLVGSNGVDFVLHRDEPYLIEVNPRFQGTMGCVERLLGINLVKEHIRACEGKLGKYRKLRGFSAKLILYARHRVKAPDLARVQGVVDIPPQGAEVARGKPLCSVLSFGETRSWVLGDAFRRAREVYRLCMI